MIQELDFLNEMVEETLKVFGTESEQDGHVIAVPIDTSGDSVMGTSASAGTAPAPSTSEH